MASDRRAVAAALLVAAAAVVVAAAVVSVVAVVAASSPAAALETDQFYAWDAELADAAPWLDARIEATLRDELRAMREAGGPAPTCAEATDRIAARFRILVFHPTELWASNTRWIERSPATAEEERAFRRRYIYRDVDFFPMAEWMPPSPTIRAGDVRFGTDKLAHFFSEGHLYLKRYRKALRDGAGTVEAEEAAIRFGILSELWILGRTSSGVFSIADLEANHAGLRFLLDLCEGDDPLLRRGPGGDWERSARPISTAGRVSPRWDESWQPSVFTGPAWKHVRAAMAEYCPALRDDPRVREQRRRYRELDRPTLTGRLLREAVEEGRVADPRSFSIEAVCAEAEAGQRAKS